MACVCWNDYRETKAKSKKVGAIISLKSEKLELFDFPYVHRTQIGNIDHGVWISWNTHIVNVTPSTTPSATPSATPSTTTITTTSTTTSTC